ncbi:MAG: bifunctional ornithine acetyltransferase/N-acetylglutamate synthase [Spirochaetaceae bacterium]|nr:bifunctional ornithine acetyltransferase/N-acetylglutamate synthase [Spirochaetaceae bacterium]
MGNTSEVYDTASAYRAALQRRALVPRGFRFAVAATEFTPAELGAEAQPLPIKLTAILAPAASAAWAAVLTRNRVTGAPVEVVRGHRGRPVRGMVINNKVANVCAAGGEAAARNVLASVGDALGVPGTELLPASTGVIGWQLPVEALAAAAPELAANLGVSTAPEAAEAIMTTDAYPKLRSAVTPSGHRVLGIAKGAGMIEPDMGTMLAFIVTDAPATADELQEELERAARSSFNAITVDGDQSTSDMAVLLSSAEREPDAPRVAGLGAAVRQVCAALAGDIVRNGEGTRHVIEIAVTSRLPEADALAVAKAVGNGPLVKTAVYGNDPNVGRIAGAVGDYLGSRPDLGHIGARDLTISLGDRQVFTAGAFTLGPALERDLSDYLVSCRCDSSGGFPPHDRVVRIGIRIDGAERSAAAAGGAPERRPRTVRVLASDLGYEYVRENADYRS